MDTETMEEPVAEEAAPEQPAPAKGGMPPEAKAAAQKLIAAAMRIVYKKEVAAKLLDMIGKAPKPEVGIAQAVLVVLKQIKDLAKGVPPKVIESMARPVAMMVLELAEKAGVVEGTPELVSNVVAMIQQAVQMAQQQAPQQPPQGAPAPAAPEQAQMQPPGGGLIENVMGA